MGIASLYPSYTLDMGRREAWGITKERIVPTIFDRGIRSLTSLSLLSFSQIENFPSSL